MNGINFSQLNADDIAKYLVTNTVFNDYKNNAFKNLSNDLIPSENMSYDLGDSDHFWGTGYLNNLYTNYLYVKALGNTETPITLFSDMLPNVSSTDSETIKINLGSKDNKFASGYISKLYTYEICAPSGYNGMVLTDSIIPSYDDDKNPKVDLGNSDRHFKSLYVDTINSQTIIPLDYSSSSSLGSLKINWDNAYLHRCSTEILTNNVEGHEEDNMYAIALASRLIPWTDNSIDLGNSDNNFKTLYVNTINSGAKLTDSIDTDSDNKAIVNKGYVDSAIDTAITNKLSNITDSESQSIDFSNFTSNIIPSKGLTYDIGNDSKRWDTIYTNVLKSNDINATATYTSYLFGNKTLTLSTDMIPSYNDSGSSISLGSDKGRFKKIYANVIDTTTVDTEYATIGVLGNNDDITLLSNIIPDVDTDNSPKTNLGSSDNKFKSIYTNNIDTNYVGSNLIPSQNTAYDLGDSNHFWANSYSYSTHTNYLYTKALGNTETTSVTLFSDIVPNVSDTNEAKINLGSSDEHFDSLYVDRISSGAELTHTIDKNSEFLAIANKGYVDSVGGNYLISSIGTYTGDGNNSQFINLGYTPDAVFTITQSGVTTHTEGGYQRIITYGGLFTKDIPLKEGNSTSKLTAAEIVDNGFTVYENYDSSKDLYIYANSSKKTYLYMAFKKNSTTVQYTD
jgi:hypothetical protein